MHEFELLHLLREFVIFNYYSFLAVEEPLSVNTAVQQYAASTSGIELKLFSFNLDIQLGFVTHCCEPMDPVCRTNDVVRNVDVCSVLISVMLHVAVCPRMPTH